jgi:hypothetical protein
MRMELMKEIRMNGLPLRLAIAIAAIMAFPSDSVGGIAVTPTCSVSIDKQVDCGGGFIDIGDVDESCIGWNRSTSVPIMPPEKIVVRWLIENTGEDELLNCTLAETNPVLSPASNIGTLSAGEIDTQTVEKNCTDVLAEAEPDTADVLCDCATDEPGDPPVARTAAATDRADFDCQTPGLNISKRCVAQLDEMGALTFDFEIDVENPGASSGATLDNCVVSDGLELGECPLETDPEPTLFEDVGTVLPGETAEVTFSGNVVDSLSCNVATVTCDVRDSIGEDGPKQLTARAEAECAPEPPLPGCRSSEKQAYTIRPGGKSKWKWTKGEATTKADFGDPTSDTEYQVCLYYSGFGENKQVSCSTVPPGVGWKESKKGYKFKSNSNTDGVSRIKLKAGEAGKTKIRVKKTGERVLLPLTATVVLQISNGEGLCWESLFSVFQKNNLRKFDAK